MYLRDVEVRMADLRKEWNVKGSMERWGDDDWLDIMTLLIRTDNFISYNPGSEKRVVPIVAKLLDKERNGEISQQQLKEELAENKLFTWAEMKNSKKIFTISMMTKIDSGIN